MKTIILATVWLASKVIAEGVTGTAFGMATGTTGGGRVTPAAPSNIAQYVTGPVLTTSCWKIY
jgi:hypothetical protein